MKKEFEYLKKLCNRKAYEIYGADCFEKAADKIDYELERIGHMSGGVSTVLAVAEYFSKARNIYRSVYGRELIYTFRGPVLSGIVPYLTGISACDPLSKDFYSWAYFIKKSKVQYNVNMCSDAYRLLSEYDMLVPENLILYVDSELDLLDKYINENKISCFSLTENSKRYDEIIQRFFLRFRDTGDFNQLIKYNDFDERYVHNSKIIFEVLRNSDMLPKSHTDLMKLSGFLHSTMKDNTNIKTIEALVVSTGNIYKELISCPEDIYEKLLLNGCNREIAERISKTIQKEGYKLTLDDRIVLADFCGDQYREQAECMKHLFYRSQIYEKSCLTAALME